MIQHHGCTQLGLDESCLIPRAGLQWRIISASSDEWIICNARHPGRARSIMISLRNITDNQYEGPFAHTAGLGDDGPKQTPVLSMSFKLSQKASTSLPALTPDKQCFGGVCLQAGTTIGWQDTGQIIVERRGSEPKALVDHGEYESNRNGAY